MCARISRRTGPCRTSLPIRRGRIRCRGAVNGRGDRLGDVITVMPWQLYLQYSDVGALKERFPTMLKWRGYLWRISNGPIVRPPPLWGAHGFSFANDGGR